MPDDEVAGFARNCAWSQGCGCNLPDVVFGLKLQDPIGDLAMETGHTMKGTVAFGAVG